MKKKSQNKSSIPEIEEHSLQYIFVDGDEKKELYNFNPEVRKWVIDKQ